MGRSSAPIQVVVHYPTSNCGKQSLAEQIARAHADMVTQYIGRLNCPAHQKQQLLDAVIQAVKNAQTAERAR